MKTCNKCKIEKELTEFHNHKKSKDGKSGTCKLCKNTLDKQYYKTNTDQVKARVAEYRISNPEIIKERKAKYYQKNKTREARKHQQWVKDNRERSREYKAKWQKNNPALVNAKTARRRAKKLQATPHWLTKKDHDRIKHIYWMADLITKITGEQHHVDHIIPLQGDNVSGLHVPENLQILTATENLSKGNKWTT